jgi:uncharacterized NAD(P)/FAD-binding protein YdhS
VTATPVVAPLIAIVGGGFTGAAVAFHLARRMAAQPSAPAPQIIVIEPRAMLGAGLAYSTTEPAHRINVPASKMSLVSEDPGHFARWLESAGVVEGDPAALTRKGDAFPQRGAFGRYVAETLAPLVAEGRVRHERQRALAVQRREDGRFGVLLEKGETLVADLVALATTHPLPATPAPLVGLVGLPGYIADPYSSDAIASIATDARVLVVGNGLTAADIVATLDRAGHRGAITALSRHGLRSRGHAPVPAEPFGDFATAPATTALALLRDIRRGILSAAEAGIGWHAVLDTVRNQGGAIWTALPETERRRLLRHLRSFWDVHRFRIAPQVEAVLDRRAAAGTFVAIAASLQAARAEEGRLAVTFRRRHAGDSETKVFDAVVNTTGPAHCSTVARPGPIQSLHAAGLVRLDRVGLGLDTAPDGQAIGADGQAVPGLFIAGPLARGTFGELMGLLEVTRYAEFIAGQLARQLEAAAPAASPRIAAG